MGRRGTVRGTRNVVVGRDVIHSIVATGDHNRFFVGGYEWLGDAYIVPWSVLEQADLGHLAGREWLLAEVDAFLRDRRRGYLILEAEAGLGKTTFLAWLVQQRGYIHHFAELAPGLEGVKRGLRNLAAQLVLAYDLGADEAKGILPDAADRPDYFARLLDRAAAARRPGEKIVLVVDALDEAGTPSGQNALGLPRVLPEGVFVVVSQRPVPVVLHTDAATTPRRVLALRADSVENQADLYCFLQMAAAWPGIAEALAKSGCDQEQWIHRMVAKCRGVWVYLRYVVYEIEQARQMPSDLDVLPDGMMQYYVRYWRCWRDEDAAQWYQSYLPLLSALAAVPGAISLRSLVQRASVTVPVERVRQWLGERWRPFIAVVRSGRGIGYRFYHPSLYDFFWGQVPVEGLTTAEQELVQELARSTIEVGRRIARRASDVALRRDVALHLTRLRWLDVTVDVRPAEMLAHLKLVERYLFSPADLEYLVQGITRMLSEPSAPPSKRQRVELLVHRAGMRGYLGRLGQAATDYEQARNLVRTVTATGKGSAKDHKLSALVGLGDGNVAAARAEMWTKPEQEGRRQEALERAVGAYLAAAESARIYGQDAVLLVTIHKELCYTYALLRNWTEADKHRSLAVEALSGVEDKETYVTYYARILDVASNMYLAQGYSLASQGHLVQACAAYQMAHKLAQDGVAILEPSSGESEDLAVAHVVAGRALLGMSGCADCPESEPVARACAHWQAALDIARRWGLAHLRKEAQECLDRYCPGSEARPHHRRRSVPGKEAR